MNDQKTRFYCQTCRRSFDSEEELLEHRDDNVPGMLHCDECDGFFKSSEAFREHFLVAHLRQA